MLHCVLLSTNSIFSRGSNTTEIDCTFWLQLTLLSTNSISSSSSIDAECIAQGIYFGFQGDLNPIFADDSSSKVFILQQQGNEKYDANALLVDMAESRVFVWLLLVAVICSPGFSWLCSK